MKALHNRPRLRRRPRLLVVSHSGSRTGAPKVLLGVVQWLAANADFEISVVFAEGGPLVDDFAKCAASVTVLQQDVRPLGLRLAARVAKSLRMPAAESWARRRIGKGATVSTKPFDLAYVNSVAALPSLEHESGSVPLLLHVHELPYAVESSLGADRDTLTALPDRYIAVSGPVLDMLTTEFEIDPARVDLVHEALPNSDAAYVWRDRAVARAELGMDPRVPMVLGCGQLGWRKGFDLFVAAAAMTAKLSPEQPAQWCWIGDANEHEQRNARFEIIKAGMSDKITLIAEQADPRVYFEAADVLLMSSKEDPYPLVVLEAALAQRPIVCQSTAAGGAAEFVSRGAGIVVPYLDIEALAQAVLTLVDDPVESARMGAKGRRLVLDGHLISSAAPLILSALRETFESARRGAS